MFEKKVKFIYKNGLNGLTFSGVECIVQLVAMSTHLLACTVKNWCQSEKAGILITNLS